MHGVSQESPIDVKTKYFFHACSMNGTMYVALSPVAHFILLLYSRCNAPITCGLSAANSRRLKSLIIFFWDDSLILRIKGEKKKKREHETRKEEQ